MIENAELTFVFLALAFAATLLGRFWVRRFTVRFRSIPAYKVLPVLAADAVESDYPLHFSFGSSSLGDSSAVSLLTSAEVVYRLVERATMGMHAPLLTLSDPLALPLAQDTLRRAYTFRQKSDQWRSTLAVWYPQGQRGLAYAAGAASLSADRAMHTNILLGRYGRELALLGEGALRHDQGLIVHSDKLEGQAIGFVQGDLALFGEELYVGPAYLDGTPTQRGGIFALELLRWLVIGGIIVEALLAVT